MEVQHHTERLPARRRNFTTPQQYLPRQVRPVCRACTYPKVYTRRKTSSTSALHGSTNSRTKDETERKTRGSTSVAQTTPETSLNRSQRRNLSTTLLCSLCG